MENGAKKYASASLIVTQLLPKAAPEVPSIGKLRVSFFQSLEKQGTLTSNAWN